MPQRAALILVPLLLWSAPSVAAPITLTVDSAQSEIASAGLISIPARQLVGTVKGDYNTGTKQLTFGGGSDVTTATNLNLSGSGTIADQTLTFAPFSLSLTGIAFSFDVSAPHLDIVAGTVVDGSGAAVPTWKGTGAGKASGSIDVDIKLGPVTVFSSSASFSAQVTAKSPFTTSNIFGFVGLSDAGAELVVTLPFALPLDLSALDLDLDIAGLPSFLSDNIDDIIDFLGDSVVDLLPSIPVPGTIVARLQREQAASAPLPPTMILLGVGLAAARIADRRARRRRRA